MFDLNIREFADRKIVQTRLWKKVVVKVKVASIVKSTQLDTRRYKYQQLELFLLSYLLSCYIAGVLGM